MVTSWKHIYFLIYFTWQKILGIICTKFIFPEYYFDLFDDHIVEPIGNISWSVFNDIYVLDEKLQWNIHKTQKVNLQSNTLRK